MPRDTIETAVKMGTGELGAERYDSVRYEGYGPGGVAFLCDLLISNANRTAAEIRTIVDKNGGKLGVPGSVAFGFTQQGVIVVPTSASVTEDRVLEAALALEVDDVRGEGEVVQVTCPPAELERVRTGLEAAGLPIDGAEVTWTPQTTVSVDVETGRRLLALLEAVEDHDDVQKIWHNGEIPDESYP
jgi:YebC/PmpR family DNA-binding regulatory protein